MRFISLIFLLLPLTGCIGSLQQLKLLDPQAEDFSSALAAEYLAFASSQAEEGQDASADYFAAKGMQAWHEEEVPLETVNPSTPAPLKNQLLAARDELSALLVDDVTAVASQQAAHAQLLFDCWARQSVSKKKSAALCAEELQTELATLEEVAVSLDMATESTANISFAPGSAKLGKTEYARVAQIAASVRGDTTYVIELQGEASSAREERLLAGRMNEIQKALRSRGISDAHIRIKKADGEKTVYLSSDRTMKDKDMVTVVTRMFDRSLEERP